MGFQEYAESMGSRIGPSHARCRLVIGIIGIVVIIACIVGYRLAGAFAPVAEAVDDRPDDLIIEAAADPEHSEEQACVHIVGCVVEPGLVRLPLGSRIADAIEAAGGFSVDADQASVNLAETIEDGMQVVVPSIEESQGPKAAEGSTSASSPSDGMAGSSSSALSGRVNLNTASLSDLMGLSGIGEAKAQRIIAYREANGRFSSVEELVNVSGIGQKTLEAIRASICV